MAKTQVFTIHYDHKHGDDYTVYSTEEKRNAALNEIFDDIAKEYNLSAEDRKELTVDNVHEFTDGREFVTIDSPDLN